GQTARSVGAQEGLTGAGGAAPVVQGGGGADAPGDGELLRVGVLADRGRDDAAGRAQQIRLQYRGGQGGGAAPGVVEGTQHQPAVGHQGEGHAVAVAYPLAQGIGQGPQQVGAGGRCLAGRFGGERRRFILGQAERQVLVIEGGF